MIGISNFPLWFGLGPSISFLSTKIPLLPFPTTSATVLTRLGIQAVPFGTICDPKKTSIVVKIYENKIITVGWQSPSYQPFRHNHFYYISHCSQPKQLEENNPGSRNRNKENQIKRKSLKTIK